MQEVKIGIIVADSDEYSPFLEAVKDYSPLPYKYYNRAAISFKCKNALCICINCGIGKVNAASAAMHLADIGCAYILNFGLSGGISDVARGNICIPERFLEHDFDLSGIGYEPCEKPNQKYIYTADEKLCKTAQSFLGEITGGTAVCGDKFICNKKDRDFLRDTFGATTCDMETAAIASVCDMANIPFLSLRRVSDDAGEDAYTSYKQMNIDEGQALSQIFLSVLKEVI